MDAEAIEIEEQSNGMCVANFVRSFACCLYCILPSFSNYTCACMFICT